MGGRVLAGPPADNYPRSRRRPFMPHAGQSDNLEKTMTVLEDDAFVRLFQERLGLTPDGWAGNDTIVKLDQMAPASAPPCGNAASIPDAYWSLLAKIESGKGSRSRPARRAHPGSISSSSRLGLVRAGPGALTQLWPSADCSPPSTSRFAGPKPSPARMQPIGDPRVFRSMLPRCTQPTSSAPSQRPKSSART